MSEDGITVVLSAEDYRFITEYDPDRERAANRTQLVDVLHDIGRMVQEGRR